MTLGEGTTGSRLEVSLEMDGATLVGELNYHVSRPRSSGRCVDASAAVVSLQPSTDVACQTGVVTRPVTCTPQNVHTGLGKRHAEVFATGRPFAFTRISSMRRGEIAV